MDEKDESIGIRFYLDKYKRQLDEITDLLEIIADRLERLQPQEPPSN